MNNLPINLKTEDAIEQYIANPGQSVGIIGEQGMNKTDIAKRLAERLLEIPEGTLDSYPYCMYIAPEEKPSIIIEQIRAINEFITLKVPSKKNINRVIIIDKAEMLTLESQNALLKNLEEPPKATVFILVAESLTSLLPTITSRLSVINIYKPAKNELARYFKDLGYDQASISQALLISDGLPELMDQLLAKKDNPVSDATTVARKILSSTTFERLSLIADLSKNKEQLKNVFFVIKQMAKIGINSNESRSAMRWQKILAATLTSEHKLEANVQVKLLLTDYVLSLG